MDPGRELNPRHADFQPAAGCSRCLLVNHLQRLADAFPGTPRVESTTGAVLVGASQLFAAPFVWRCRNRSTVNPSPVAAHRTGHAGPHPALGQDLRPSFSDSHARSVVSSTRPSVS